jgi:OmpA-OmpF porin, OOP family
MAVKIEKGGWFLIFALGLGLVGYALNKYGILESLIPSAKVNQSTDVARVDLPTLSTSSAPVNVAPAAMPSGQRGCGDKPEVRFYHWAWNAQMGLMFASGGKEATKGSLMCDKGVNLRLIREDDVSKMQEALVAMAQDYKAGKEDTSKGAHFVAIMGDGAATFLKGLNDTLRKLGPEYTAKVVGSAGGRLLARRRLEHRAEVARR